MAVDLRRSIRIDGVAFDEHAMRITAPLATLESLRELHGVGGKVFLLQGDRTIPDVMVMLGGFAVEFQYAFSPIENLMFFCNTPSRISLEVGVANKPIDDPYIVLVLFGGSLPDTAPSVSVTG